MTVSGYNAIGQYFNPAPVGNDYILGTDPYASLSYVWGTAMYAISLGTNIIVTLLTAGRIWYGITIQILWSLHQSNATFRFPLGGFRIWLALRHLTEKSTPNIRR